MLLLFNLDKLYNFWNDYFWLSKITWSIIVLLLGAPPLFTIKFQIIDKSSDGFFRK